MKNTFYVKDKYTPNRTIYYPAAEMLMDEEIREALHQKLAPCSNQRFYNAYCKAHEKKYQEEFIVD